MFYNSNFSSAMSCSMELIGEESTENTKTMNYKCSKCNLEYTTKDTTFNEISSECYRYYEFIKIYKNINGKDVVIKNSGIEEQHSGVWNEYDLSVYGVCGGKLSLCECETCEELVNFLVDATACNMITNSENSEYKSYTDTKCTECGFRRFLSNREIIDENNPCIAENEIHYLVEIGNIELVNDIDVSKYKNCFYTVKTTNEFADCNEGVIYELTCKNCNEKIIAKMYGHIVMFTERYDISETECCSESLRITNCACGKNGQIDSEYCIFATTSSTSFSDEYGMPHVLYIQNCVECRITREIEDYYVDGGDVYEYHRDYAIYFDEEEVLASVGSIMQYVSK